MSEIKPASPADIESIDKAIAHLRAARDLLRGAGAPKATDVSRRAIASAGGAARHARHRLARSKIAASATESCPPAGS